MDIKIIILLIVGFVFYMLFKPKFSITIFEKNIKEIKKIYGYDIANQVEQIYRLETAHMTSEQFLKTYSAGMMSFGNSYPFGWFTIHNIFWKEYPQFKPIGTKIFIEHKGLLGEGGGEKYFLEFPTLKAAMFTLAGFLNYYKNPAKWYSNNPDRQYSYLIALSKINTKFT